MRRFYFALRGFPNFQCGDKSALTSSPQSSEMTKPWPRPAPRSTTTTTIQHKWCAPDASEFFRKRVTYSQLNDAGNSGMLNVKPFFSAVGEPQTSRMGYCPVRLQPIIARKIAVYKLMPVANNTTVDTVTMGENCCRTAHPDNGSNEMGQIDIITDIFPSRKCAFDAYFGSVKRQHVALLQHCNYGVC